MEYCKKAFPISLVLLLMCFVATPILAQEKEFAAAMQQKETSTDGFYMARFSDNQKEKDLDNWVKKNSDKYKVYKKKTYQKERFGTLDVFVSIAYFLPKGDADKKDQKDSFIATKTVETEKQKSLARSAADFMSSSHSRTRPENLLSLGKKYPGLNIITFVENHPYYAFCGLSKEVVDKYHNPYYSDSHYEPDIEKFQNFLRTYPEVKPAQLEEVLLSRVYNPDGYYNMKAFFRLETFANMSKIFNNPDIMSKGFTAFVQKKIAKNQQISEGEESYMVQFRDKTDLSGIMNALYKVNELDFKTFFAMCEKYVPNKYFTKDLNTYFSSCANYQQLQDDISKTVGLVTANRVEYLKENIYNDYIYSRFDKIGASAWRELSDCFPQKKTEILKKCVSRYVVSSYYKECKYTAEGQQIKSNNEKVISNLKSFVAAGVPDSQANADAKVRLTEAEKYALWINRDYQKAQEYESQLRSKVTEIQNKIKNTTIAPPYRTKKTSDVWGGETLWLEIDGGTYSVSITYKEGYYSGGDIKARSLGEYAREYMKQMVFFESWCCGGFGFMVSTKEPDYPLMERVLRDYNQYGMDQWYKINNSRYR